VLAFQFKETECEVVDTPDPDSEIVAGELDALLVIETLPVTLPVVVGANVTVRIIFCPASSVSGGVTPLALKPAPETVTWEMVTLELPVFESVAVWELLVPTVTSPKERLVGLAEIWYVALTPVPERGTVVGESGASLTMERLPVTLPAPVGANATLKVDVCPGLKGIGKVSPVVLKPEPETVI
jgi:hypothetical protein